MHIRITVDDNQIFCRPRWFIIEVFSTLKRSLADIYQRQRVERIDGFSLHRSTIFSTSDTCRSLADIYQRQRVERIDGFSLHRSAISSTSDTCTYIADT
jgi:hypothetical protein